MIKRIMAEKLKVLASKFPVVSVIGPRQSGKTTLVRNVFADTDYVSLEDPDTREFAHSDPRGFLATHNKGAVIDEAQRVPNLFSYIQTAVDSKKGAGRFILTGSQNILLQENLSQTLAGRVAILRLLPLSIDELKTTKYSLNSPEDCLFRGLYPRIYDKHINAADWYPNYIQTYVERDVRLIKNISDLHAFQKFVKMCAGRIGQCLNLSSLGDDCGITHNTAKSWLSILEATYLVFLIRPYHRNLNKRLIKMPKMYFYDTGLACSLLGIQNVAQLDTHYLKGSLFESFVLSEILKDRFNKGIEPNCFYWRDKTGNEIDCIIETGESVLSIEIKAGKTISEDFFAGLRYWRQLVRRADKNAYVIYGGDENQKRSYGSVISWRNITSIFQRRK